VVVTVRPLTPRADSRGPAVQTQGRSERQVLRRAHPRVEHDPSISGENAAGRLGGFYTSIEIAAEAAVILDLDVLIPRAHPRMGFWLTPLHRDASRTPSRRSS